MRVMPGCEVVEYMCTAVVQALREYLRFLDYEWHCQVEEVVREGNGEGEGGREGEGEGERGRERVRERGGGARLRWL